MMDDERGPILGFRRGSTANILYRPSVFQLSRLFSGRQGIRIYSIDKITSGMRIGDVIVNLEQSALSNVLTNSFYTGSSM